MIHKSIPHLLAAALACSAAFAQDSDPKPLSEADLLKQIETLNPQLKPATPAPTIARRTAPAPPDLFRSTSDALNPNPSSNSNANPARDASKPAASSDQPGDKKAKGPTEITALEATFDQRKNVAVFLQSVVVKDPEFNVVCDKLTAYLKHDEKPLEGAGGATGATGANGVKGVAKATPGAATPKPVTSAPATPSPAKAGAATASLEGGTPVKKKSGGLRFALAEMTSSERRVIITQDKVEADGSITHGIGISDFAFYDAVTGDITLWGMPDVTQGVDRCIATDPSTVMTLNRDGQMTARGPHRTIITDTGDSRGPTPTPKPATK